MQHILLYGDFFMKKYLKEYIYSNFNNIFTIFLFIIIGLVVGIVVFHTSNETVKTDIINNAINTLDIAKNKNFEGINITINSICMNLFVIFTIYFASITLIPKLLINMISLLKGISLGLYIPVLFSIFGISNGILSLVLLIIIPNLIYITSYIFLSNNAILFHDKIIKENFKISFICIEAIKIVIVFSLMLVAVMLEQIAAVVIIGNYLK